MKRPNRCLLAIAVSLVASPFAPEARSAGDLALDRPQGWVLSSITSAADAKPALAGKGEVTLVVKGRKLHGNAGVNSYSGSVRTTARGGFRVGEIGMTEMAGDPAMMRQESQFIGLLVEMRSYQIADGKLLLSDADGTRKLGFSPKRPDAPAPLVGTRWNFTGFEAGDGVSVSFEPPVKEGAVHLKLGEDGNATGSGGVNSFSAGFELAPGKRAIEFGEMASTLIGAGGEIMKQEMRFFKTLPEMTRYRIEGDRLALSDGKGKTRLLFEAGQ